MNQPTIPTHLAKYQVKDLTQPQILEILETTVPDGIRLSFTGKAIAREVALRVRPRVLTTVKRSSIGNPENQSRNLLIEGDNLQTMVTLYKFRGQVDLVIADPPYNTGNDFRYNDKWDDDPNDEGLGDLVTVEDGDRHTKWLKFMLPRLQLMKAMLKPAGVAAICIDERELFRLGLMMDEIFGRDNRLAIINWQKASAPKNDKNHVASTTEYILVYAKDHTQSRTGALPRAEETRSRYRNWDDDPRGEWREHDLTARTSVRKDQYGIQSPFTGVIHYPSGTRSWSHPKRNIKAWLEEWGSPYVTKSIGDGRPPALMLKGGLAIKPETQSEEQRLRTIDGTVPAAVSSRARKRLVAKNWPFIWFGLDGDGGPRTKKHWEGIRKGFVPTTYWSDDADLDLLNLGSTSWEWEQSGLSQSGSKELTAIVGPGHGFDTVKPLQLFTKLLQIWCPNEGLVMDPFAGSGTTGHAVLYANHYAGSNRRFMLIEQGSPESGDPYARTLTRQRLRRVISGDWWQGKAEPLGGGFAYLRLDRRIDAEAVLRMERSEMRDTVVFSHFNEGRRRREPLCPIDPDLIDSYRYLVAQDEEGHGFFLVWGGPDRNTDLTREVYSQIVEEAKRAKLRLGRYYVYARRWIYQRNTTVFHQIPDYILASFGLDMKSEPFANEEFA